MTYTPSGDMQAHLANEVQVKIRERYTTDNTDDQVAPLFSSPRLTLSTTEHPTL